MGKEVVSPLRQRMIEDMNARKLGKHEASVMDRRGTRLRLERESSVRTAGKPGQRGDPQRWEFFSAELKMSRRVETRRPCQAARSIRVVECQFHGSSAARSLIL